MIEELIAKVFATRNAAHLHHWSAKGDGSYARHEALGDFYNDVIEKIDGIVEIYQGAHGLVGTVGSNTPVGKDFSRHLTDEAKWIDDNREAISRDICAIENALDELAGIYYRTAYKIKNLS